MDNAALVALSNESMDETKRYPQMGKSSRPKQSSQIGRRAFLQNGVLVLATATSLTPNLSFGIAPPETALTFGLVTDIHYADKASAGSRFYRQSIKKLNEAAIEFQRHNLSFVVELGDLIDSADSVQKEQEHLKRVNDEFSKTCKRRHYVLGNHCVHTLTKQEFLEGVEQKRSYYSFDVNEFHFVVLDACFRADGKPYGRKNFEWTDANIPAAEVDWLKEDLKNTSKKTIVFAHQRLDGQNVHCVKNASEIRNVLQDSGNVLAVFQGHSHQNDLKELGGIHYCTMVAMIEGSGLQNNGYSILKLSQDGTIQLTGFRNQLKREF